MRRKSTTFWQILGEHAIGSTILRVPITFPPEKFNGRLLSAMCTPDLRGTQGSFSWFTTRQGDFSGEGGSRYPLTSTGGIVTGALEGPEGITTPFRIADGSIEIGGSRTPSAPASTRLGSTHPLRTASAGPVRGIVRFLLTETGDETSLYATPVQIDPENPALPISQPRYYAIYLSKLLGPFSTLGMAEDTWALNEGAIDEDAFLTTGRRDQTGARGDVLQRSRPHPPRRRGLRLRYYRPRAAHVLPLPRSAATGRHEQVIEELYRDMDRLVGETLRYADSETALFVLSDHGFCSFRRGVNLNAWLHQNGYLTLEDGATEGGKYFEARGLEPHAGLYARARRSVPEHQGPRSRRHGCAKRGRRAEA